jgi:hypothetical protein
MAIVHNKDFAVQNVRVSLTLCSTLALIGVNVPLAKPQGFGRHFQKLIVSQEVDRLL